MEPDGYFSEEAKRTYLRSVRVWGVCCIFLQVFLPMAFLTAFVTLMNAFASSKGGAALSVLVYFAVSNLLGFVLPVLLAWVVSKKGLNSRTGRVAAENAAAALATIWKRALAQMIDAFVIAVPAVVISTQLAPNFLNMPKENPFEYLMFQIIELLLRLSLWLAAGLVIFSLLEGVYGATPGKYVLKIKVVGLDLRPCGFGRALVRNIFKLLDGILNFTVGIFVAALSEKNQRIGDRIAGTVVIEKGDVSTSRQ